MISLARQSYLRKTAALALLAAAAVAGAPSPAERAPNAGDYELMVLLLRTHQAQLSGLQSIEKRIELKRQLLPEYAGWVQGRLDAAAQSDTGIQDDVLVTVMLWRVDVGDFDGALPLAEYALRYKLAMPERFSRSVACYLAEDVAEAAIKLLAAKQPAPAVLPRVAELTEGHDMPDQVRAKVHKALGLEALRVSGDAEACAASGVPSAARIFKKRAHDELSRANHLHAGSGVKTDLKRLEKELNMPLTDGEETAAQT